MTLSVVLDRLKQNIFIQPYASAGKDSYGGFAPARKTSKSYALGLPIIQFNGPRQKRYLCFDIDREFGGFAWDEANLPIPNLVIANPVNGHAHLVYELEKPVWERRDDDDDRGDAQPLRYLKAVSSAMKTALRADPGYSGFLTKNPFHADWHTVCGREKPYTLGELSAHLDLASAPTVETKLRDNAEGRNCTLFDSIRVWAYRAKQAYSDLMGFRCAIDRKLDHLNSELAYPLAPAELRGIAKSVSRWVWNKYEGNGSSVRRGICNLNSSDPLPLRQQQGQAYVCTVKLVASLRRMKLAIESLVKRGVALTKAAVAKEAGLHRNTVSRHWHKACGDSANSSAADLFVPWTVTEEGTECLRHKSSVPPAGAATLAGGTRIPDGTPKGATLSTIRVLERLRAHRDQKIVEQPSTPRSRILNPHVQRVLDRIHERSTQRHIGCIPSSGSLAADTRVLLS